MVQLVVNQVINWLVWGFALNMSSVMSAVILKGLNVLRVDFEKNYKWKV